MSFKPSIALLMAVVTCIAVAPVAAFQSAAKKDDAAKARDERRKKALSMTDEIIKDAQALRLPENRLRLLVQTASAIWPADEKRARVLIKSAQESLKELQAAIDNKDPQYLQLDSFVSQMRSGVRPPVQKALDKLQAIPVDIEPQFTTADDLVKRYR